jgi:hypothetical protein
MLVAYAHVLTVRCLSDDMAGSNLVNMARPKADTRKVEYSKSSRV